MTPLALPPDTPRAVVENRYQIPSPRTAVALPLACGLWRTGYPRAHGRPTSPMLLCFGHTTALLLIPPHALAHWSIEGLPCTAQGQLSCPGSFTSEQLWIFLWRADHLRCGPATLRTIDTNWHELTVTSRPRGSGR